MTYNLSMLSFHEICLNGDTENDSDTNEYLENILLQDSGSDKRRFWEIFWWLSWTRTKSSPTTKRREAWQILPIGTSSIGKKQKVAIN